MSARCALRWHLDLPFRGRQNRTVQPGVKHRSSSWHDLNTAGLDALCTLPGVGEQRARAIIEYREQYGRFAAVEEAAAVPGLTEAVVDEWDGLAYVS